MDNKEIDFFIEIFKKTKDIIDSDLDQQYFLCLIILELTSQTDEGLRLQDEFIKFLHENKPSEIKNQEFFRSAYFKGGKVWWYDGKLPNLERVKFCDKMIKILENEKRRNEI